MWLCVRNRFINSVPRLFVLKTKKGSKTKPPWIIAKTLDHVKRGAGIWSQDSLLTENI